MTTIKIKKTYKFALKTSLLIGALILVLFLFFHNTLIQLNTTFITLATLASTIISFIIIQYRIEHFIYNRVKKVYDDLTLLESTDLKKEHITTDMATLTKEIDKYAKDKKIEIEALKIRESYRREFLGNISHELKTPLFTVQGYISTLIDGAINDKNVRDKYLKRADKGLERLIYIVKDLDMISKLEIGNLNLQKETFNIIELINNVFDLLEMKAEKKHITLTLDKHYSKAINVFADKDRIQQVLTNLIVNSIKYGRENGTTEVSIESANNKLIVRITDNGEGIKKQHIPRLFERFYRVDKSGSRKEGGSGLGLAIVKHIIEAHDEKIYIESEVGVGSEFSFTLEQVI